MTSAPPSSDPPIPPGELLRMKLDERLAVAKLESDERLGKARLEFDGRRDHREGNFFRAYGAALIAATIAAVSVGVSGWEFLSSRSLESTRAVATENSRHHDQNARLDDQRLKVLNYLTENRLLIFAADSTKDPERKQLRTIMLSGLPAATVRPLFEQLKLTTPRGEQIWKMGKQGFKWTPAGYGDCGGRDILPYTEGESPKETRCDAGFEGRIAVCWDNEVYKNPTSGRDWSKWCTYKLITPDACIGGGSRGSMYQCTSSFADE